MPVVVHVRVVDDFFVQFIDWVDVPVLCSDVSVGCALFLGRILYWLGYVRLALGALILVVG